MEPGEVDGDAVGVDLSVGPDERQRSQGSVDAGGVDPTTGATKNPLRRERAPPSSALPRACQRGLTA